MKRILFYAMVLLSSAAVMSCNQEKDNGPVDNPDKVRLQMPSVELKESTATSVTICWEAVEHADSYQWRFDGETEFNDVGEALEAVIENLTANLNYTVQVRAVANQDSEYISSSWATFTFTFEPAKIEPDPWLQSWLGEYKIMTEGSVVYTIKDNMMNFEYVEEPIEFTISIQPSPYELALEIYGLSAAADFSTDPVEYFPATAVIMNDGQGNYTGLGIALGQNTIVGSYDMGNAMWLPLIKYQDSEGKTIVAINSNAMITNLGYWAVDTYDWTPFTGMATLQNGEQTEFTATAAEVFIDQGGGNYGQFFLFNETHTEYSLPAGALNIVEKLSGEEAAAVRSNVVKLPVPAVYAASQYELTIR
ncbi:MAG TPA: fibronectin type III domain-containing protein [Candidatus Coprenecus pullistercoris]|nr:fibronectin type III domain-containing protein [Candidatus Coprenecus pullistercoris]